MKFEWVGSVNPYLDEVFITEQQHVTIGCFGGSVSGGASKNEDGMFVLADGHAGWTFAVIVDAHHTAGSAELILRVLNGVTNELVGICNSEAAFQQLEPFILSLFTSVEFKGLCSNITGEASFLICYQRGAYLWWFSVGDCVAMLLHPDLARFKQYSLNQRQFFEWVGQANALDLPVLCYTTGRRQLRKGKNHLVLLTDGVFDTTDRYFEDHANLYRYLVNGNGATANLAAILDCLSNKGTKDSASILHWAYTNDLEGLRPSDEGGQG